MPKTEILKQKSWLHSFADKWCLQGSYKNNASNALKYKI